MDMMRKIYLLIRAIPKTLYFNFKYLPFKQAIKLPILVSHRMWLMTTGGRVKLSSHSISPFMVKMGFNEVGIFDQMRSRGVINLNGEIEFKGAAAIGHGSKISVEKEGKLTIGENVIITAETSIICTKEINIGNDVMLSWEVQIMDSDLHQIMDKDKNIINPSEKVNIGDKTWIGCRCLILKGTNLKKGTIVAAGTTVSKSANIKIEKENSLIGGNPLKVLKEEVTFKI